MLVEHGRRELQLRISELKGEVMLNNYLEEHADEVREGTDYLFVPQL
eukprot:COSAG02_NODE_2598_length_8449_cov_59.030042_5_plen_47_part_00